MSFRLIPPPPPENLVTKRLLHACKVLQANTQGQTIH